ncbi:hypothetical protein [Streptomyces monashensis]|uniref:Uncharacterized protein n=1 Tax=Streptomyces monashensis TaxID=1678012 RepID=A0A1S2Q520_9ACTN|nr:hypothetical protein [Streptomyces monashensis]OIK01212.1 hypothetical protein BIV23_26085 [Streptomyces monashensis]
MGDPAAQQKVDNPWRAALVSLKNDLMSETERLKGLLATVDADMQGKKVWTSETGGVAANFRDDLHGKKQRIGTLVGKLIPAVEAEIAKCPEQVPPGEAKMMRMEMQGY